MQKFDMVVAGVGGQGILTIAGLVARAALQQGYEIKASELHGLAMRFGALECHLRIGDKVHSPLIKHGGADLIVTLEPAETLRVNHYAGPETSYIFDTHIMRSVAIYIQKLGYPTVDEIIQTLKKASPKGRVIPVDASAEAKRLFGTPQAANIFIVGRAAAEGLIPVKRDLLFNALAEIFPEKLLDLNKKVFEAGYKSKK